ncbi:MAG: hypothetical protein ACI837_002428 [Crocinitomicaceae bacterium]|jgi:hypothetical protein
MEEVGAYIKRRKAGTGLYYDLFSEAIGVLQQLASDSWTDYNAHDPGVTLLENTIYGMSDLAYRSDFKMQDLLLTHKNHVLQSGDNGLFVASDILTTNPVTSRDMRKIILDEIPEVGNVWVEEVDHDLLHLDNATGLKGFRGLFRIAVEMSTYDSDSTKQKELKQRVREVFHTQRNLCEYLYETHLYRPFNVTFKLNISIDNDANGEELLGVIYRNLLSFFSQEVEFKSLWELQEMDIPTNDIFNGPKLESGFIKDDSLKKRKSQFSILEIVKLINITPGVVRVNSFDLHKESEVTEGLYEHVQDEILYIPDYQFANLVLPPKSEDVVFQSAGLTYDYDQDAVVSELAYLSSVSYGNARSGESFKNELAIPQGTYRNIEEYYQIRYQLPDAYGIGENGLIIGLQTERYAQAKQLKAFLMPIDQMMANMLSQMAHLNEFYDASNMTSRTYFSQVLSDAEVEAELLNPPLHSTTGAQLTWSQTLREMDRKSNRNTYDRSISSVRDLLARYSERFPDYALRKIFKTNFPDEHVHVIDERILLATREYVRNYGEMSYNRSKAVDYLRLIDAVDEHSNKVNDIKNVPAILRKLSLFLGIEDSSIRSITSELARFEIRLSTNPIDTISNQNDNEKKLSTNATGARDFQFRGTPPFVLDETLRHGVVHKNYRLVKGDYRPDEIWMDVEGEERYLVHVAGADENADGLIDLCVRELKLLDKKSEGIFLVEHILMLPLLDEANFGFKMSLTALSPELTINLHQIEKENFQARTDSVKWLVEELGSNGVTAELRDNQITEKYYLILLDENEQTIARSEYFPYGELDKLTAQKELLVTCLGAITDEQLQKISSKTIYYAFYGDNYLDEEFFALKLSFILPSWPVRFQDTNFKNLINNSLEDNLPVHLLAKTYWLSYDGMVEFERIYFNWLHSLKSARGSEPGSQRTEAYQLIKFLVGIETMQAHGNQL